MVEIFNNFRIFFSKTSYSQIKNQLQADLNGKDSYRGITLSYAWLANQLGHFTLGFAPSLFFSVIFTWIQNNFFIQSLFEDNITYYHLIINWVTIPAFSSTLVFSIWLFYECRNYVKQVRESKYFIEIGRASVFWDTIVDLMFFFLGSISAYFFLDHSNSHSWTFYFMILLFTILLMFAGTYWYVIKINIQNARFPKQFRLSQWNFDISKSNIRLVKNYVKKIDNSNHLIITGGTGSGKSSLGIGIASEYAMNNGKIIYITAIKYCEVLAHYKQADESLAEKNSKRINARKAFDELLSADIIIMDDLTPGSPITDALIGANEFFNVIKNHSQNHDFVDLKNKKVIWVIGKDEHFEVWRSFIVNQIIGTSDKEIVIDLNDLEVL
jgi:hypothetical protein